MKIEEIIALGKMGYTKEDIDRLTTESEKPEVKIKPSKHVENPVETVEKPVETVENSESYDKIAELLADIKTAIQAGNIGEPAYNMRKQSTVETLAQIVNPDYKPKYVEDENYGNI